MGGRDDSDAHSRSVEFVVESADVAEPGGTDQPPAHEKLETRAGALPRWLRWALAGLGVVVLAGLASRLVLDAGPGSPAAAPATSHSSGHGASPSSVGHHPLGQLLAEVPQDTGPGAAGTLLVVDPADPPCPDAVGCTAGPVPRAALAAVRSRIPHSVPTRDGQLSVYLPDGKLYFRQINVRRGTFVLTVQVVPTTAGATEAKSAAAGSSRNLDTYAQHVAHDGYLARFGLADTRGMYHPNDSVLRAIASDPRLVLAASHSSK
jgi:hypothetical protein